MGRYEIELAIFKDLKSEYEEMIAEANERVEKEVKENSKRFFSRYEGKEIPKELVKIYEDDLREFLTEKESIKRTKSHLEDIIEKIKEIEARNSGKIDDGFDEKKGLENFKAFVGSEDEKELVKSYYKNEKSYDGDNGR